MKDSRRVGDTKGRFNIHIPTTLHRRLKIHAARHDTTISALIEQAAQRFLADLRQADGKRGGPGASVPPLN